MNDEASDGRKDLSKIVYYWLGEKREFIGRIDGNLIGRSDFGEFVIDCKNLKHLKFIIPSFEVVGEKDTFHPIGYVVLEDGTTVKFDDLRNHSVIFSQTKKFIGPKSPTPTIMGEIIREYQNVTVSSDIHTKDFSFKRGATNAELQFDKIKSIEFGNKRDSFVREVNFTVTLKNGAITEGRISNKHHLIGLTGTSEKGDFYINREHLKAIYFE